MRTMLMLLVLHLARVCAGQEYPRTEIDVARITDDLIGFQDEDLAYEEMYEYYLLLYNNPLDINKATIEQLRQLNILTEQQIQSIISHISHNGKLLSVYELQSIDNIDAITFYRLIPFVAVTPVESELNGGLITRMRREQRTYLVTRVERTFETARGFHSENEWERFAGSPEKVYLRMRSQKVNDFSYGFTLEKDAGEAFSWSPKTGTFGFDYLSYHLQLINKKSFANLIAGDYQFQFGQGLILGNAFGTGKGGETITTVRKCNTGFSPYTSVNEAAGLRGIACSLKLHPNFFLSPYYSQTRRDASIWYDYTPTFSSILTGGLHRTKTELEKRKNLGERVYGLVANYKSGAFDGGVITQVVEYDAAMLKAPNSYNQFAFGGDRNINAGVFVNYLWENLNLFGEAAKSLRAGTGVVAGLLASLSKELDVAMLFRRYRPDFYPFYGNAFAENSSSQNESGFYWGFKYRFNRKVTLAAYADLFYFPWLKFRTYSPTRGNECLLRLNYQPTRKANLFVQYRREAKPRNSVDESTVYSLNQVTRHNATVNCDIQVSSNLKLKTRGQFSILDKDGSLSSGTVMLQDLSFRLGKFEFSARYAIFQSDNYDNRQYVYERDLWLAYSFPAYDGWGLRNLAILEYKLTRHVALAARYSRTSFKDRDQIGSGLQLIRGNQRNDLKLQAVFKL